MARYPRAATTSPGGDPGHRSDPRLRPDGRTNNGIEGEEYEDPHEEKDGARCGQGEKVLIEQNGVEPSGLRPERTGELAARLNQRQKHPERNSGHSKSQPDPRVEPPPHDRASAFPQDERNKDKDSIVVAGQCGCERGAQSRQGQDAATIVGQRLPAEQGESGESEHEAIRSRLRRVVQGVRDERQHHGDEAIGGRRPARHDHEQAETHHAHRQDLRQAQGPVIHPEQLQGHAGKDVESRRRLFHAAGEQ